MTTQQSESDQRLAEAMRVAVDSLKAMLRKAPSAQEVRTVLYDISLDARAPLPVSIQAHVPPRSRAIVSDNELTRLIIELNHEKKLCAG